MKRWSFGLTLLCSLVLSAGAAFHAVPAHAAPAKKKAKKSAAADKVPESAEIAKAMEEVRWACRRTSFRRSLSTA